MWNNNKNITRNYEHFGRLICTLVPFQDQIAASPHNLKSWQLSEVIDAVYGQTPTKKRRGYLRVRVRALHRFLCNFITERRMPINVEDSQFRTHRKLGMIASAALQGIPPDPEAEDIPEPMDIEESDDDEPEGEEEGDEDEQNRHGEEENNEEGEKNRQREEDEHEEEGDEEDEQEAEGDEEDEQKAEGDEEDEQEEEDREAGKEKRRGQEEDEMRANEQKEQMDQKEKEKQDEEEIGRENQGKKRERREGTMDEARGTSRRKRLSEEDVWL